MKNNFNRFTKLKKSYLNRQLFQKLFLLVLVFIFCFNIFYPLSVQAAETFVKNNHSRASMDEEGNIYMRENLHSRIHPASLTKIAISILAIEKLKLKDKVLIEKIDYVLPFDYVVTPVYIGETLTVEDLLHAAMLKSGNDATIYLAKHVFKSKEAFVQGINEYLKDLGLLNTNFTNSFGLEDPEHYTTPYDLLLLVKHAMKNKTFKDIVSKEKYVIPENEFSNARTLYTTSMFADEGSSVFNKNFYGIKSGYTEKAGDCFIAASKISNKEFYFIYTGANSRISKFIKIQEMLNQTKYILEEKSKIDQYAKTSSEAVNNQKLNINYLHSKYLFSTFDKILFLVFVLIIILILFKINFRKKRKRKRRK